MLYLATLCVYKMHVCFMFVCIRICINVNSMCGERGGTDDVYEIECCGFGYGLKSIGDLLVVYVLTCCVTCSDFSSIRILWYVLIRNCTIVSLPFLYSNASDNAPTLTLVCTKGDACYNFDLFLYMKF